MAQVIEFEFKGVDRTTNAVRSATQNVKKFDQAVQSSARGATQFGAATGMATRSTKKFTMGALQQAGYQVGDYAVQVANGTSAMQAFGQQGSQFLGIFGPVGAVLGAAVAIVSAVSIAMSKAGGTVKSFTEEVDELVEASDAYSDVNISTRQSILNMRDAFTDTSEEVVKLFEAQKQLAEFNLATQMNETVLALQKQFNIAGMINEEFGKAAGTLMSYNMAADRQLGTAMAQEFAIKKVAESFGLTVAQLRILESEMKALDEIDVFGNPTEAARLLGSIFDKVTAAGLENIDKKGREAAESLLSLRNVLLKIRADNKDTSRSIAGVVDLTKNEFETLSTGISRAMGNSFGDIIKGTKSVKEAFKSMASAVVDELINVLIVQRLVGAISGAFDTIFPGAAGKGGAGKGAVKQGAVGGTVQAGRPMIVGEKGREVFIPNSGGQLVPNHRINAGGQGVVVNQTINVSTGVSQTVRAEIASLMPQISEASKNAVLDARRRGGSFANAFGR